MLISCSNSLDEINSESFSGKSLISKREIRSINQAKQIAVNYLNANNRFTGKRNIQGKGHAYIIDGYIRYSNKDSFVHINFGWRSGGNGYFMKNILNPKFIENVEKNILMKWISIAFFLNK